MRLNQRTHLSTVTLHQHEFCIQRSPAATVSQNKLFTPSSFLLFQRKSSIFLICKVLALIPLGYDNVLPAKPPPEGLGTQPHRFTGVQQGNKHKNTDDQTRRKQTCRYFPRIELFPHGNAGQKLQKYVQYWREWNISFPFIGIKLNHTSMFPQSTVFFPQWLQLYQSLALLSNLWAATIRLRTCETS